MKIKITLADIRKAKEETRKFEEHETWYYSRAETCPIAFALKRMFPGAHVVVSPSLLYLGDKYVAHSKSVESFISETDRKKDKIRPRESWR